MMTNWMPLYDREPVIMIFSRTSSWSSAHHLACKKILNIGSANVDSFLCCVCRLHQIEMRQELSQGNLKVCCSDYLVSWLNSSPSRMDLVQRFSRAGPRGRAREWATLGVHPLSWLLTNNRLEEVCITITKDTFSSRLLLSNQDNGCTPSVAHSLPLPPGFCSTCQLLEGRGVPVCGKTLFNVD